MPQLNSVSWFEIPATDLDRAQRFYETVLGFALEREAMGPEQMAVFPYQRGEGVCMPWHETPCVNPPPL